MKRIIATSAIALALFSGAASAMTSSSLDEATIRGYAPNADVSQLSETALNGVLNIINSGDSEGEKRAEVRAFLMNQS